MDGAKVSCFGIFCELFRLLECDGRGRLHRRLALIRPSARFLVF